MRRRLALAFGRPARWLREAPTILIEGLLMAVVLILIFSRDDDR